MTLCGMWGQYSSAAAVYGIVGGIGFTQPMLAKAQEHGLLTVAPAHGLYEVSSPPGGPRNAKLLSSAPGVTGAVEATSASTPGDQRSELPRLMAGAGEAPTIASIGSNDLGSGAANGCRRARNFGA